MSNRFLFAPKRICENEIFAPLSVCLTASGIDLKQCDQHRNNNITSKIPAGINRKHCLNHVYMFPLTTAQKAIFIVINRSNHGNQSASSLARVCLFARFVCVRLLCRDNCEQQRRNCSVCQSICLMLFGYVWYFCCCFFIGA